MIHFDAGALKALRRQRGWSAQQMARVLDASKSSYLQWESGQQIPSGRTMLKLMNKFEAEPDFFFKRNGKRRMR